jgi:hypothetical protein
MVINYVVLRGTFQRSQASKSQKFLWQRPWTNLQTESAPYHLNPHWIANFTGSNCFKAHRTDSPAAPLKIVIFDPNIYGMIKEL